MEDQKLLELITLDPEVMVGKPVIKGATGGPSRILALV